MLVRGLGLITMVEDLRGRLFDFLPERRILVGFDGRVPVIVKHFRSMALSPAAAPAQHDRDGPLESRIGPRLTAQEEVSPEAGATWRAMINAVVTLPPEQLGRRSGQKEADVVANRNERQTLARLSAAVAKRSAGEAGLVFVGHFAREAQLASHHGMARRAVGLQLVGRNGDVDHKTRLLESGMTQGLGRLLRQRLNSSSFSYG